MRKKEAKEIERRLDQLENAPANVKKPDKMSKHFVVPLVAFYLIVGVLLILLNELVTNIAAWVLAAGLVLIGGWLLVRYFRSDIEARLAGTDLALGLVLFVGGALLVIYPTDMKEVFPKIWGLSLIFGGFLKCQYAFDERSVKVQKWWIMLIFATVSLAIGVLALLKDKVFGTNQYMVIGIFMIAEAVLDVVTYILLTRGTKRITEARNAAHPAGAQTPAEPAPAPQPLPQPEEQ